MCSSSKQHIENANSHYNYNNYNDLEGKPYPATDINSGCPNAQWLVHHGAILVAVHVGLEPLLRPAPGHLTNLRQGEACMTFAGSCRMTLCFSMIRGGGPLTGRLTAVYNRAAAFEEGKDHALNPSKSSQNDATAS